jgi:acylphosphatase
MPERVAIRAVIRGRVQGVWYRGWTEAEARARGLAGWVRNLPDGAVEALFVGPAADVDAMLAACRDGPPAAQVTGIETGAADMDAAITGFRIRR